MRRKIIPYNPALNERARQLRNNSTKTEIKLWKFLKGRQMCGYDFHRQKPLDNYIVDFFCNELMLAIELDGLSHLNSEKYDNQRQDKLESIGVKFLRIDDDEVFFNIEKVLNKIEAKITELEQNAQIK